MQMRGRARERVSLLGKARRRFLGLSPAEASFAKRGFITGEMNARLRLEQIGITFLSGYHAALEETGFVPLARRLATVDAETRGFAFEGAAMGLAILDCLTPWRKDRWPTFTEQLAKPHVYMMHVGLGWALARLRRCVTTHLARLDPLLGWLVVDGYGFHEGYFRWPQYVEQRAIPAHLDGYARRVFDQGLGRSIWFVKGADVAAVASAINAFPPARRDDLWSGAGLACAYAGGCERVRNAVVASRCCRTLAGACARCGIRRQDTPARSEPELSHRNYLPCHVRALCRRDRRNHRRRT